MQGKGHEVDPGCAWERTQRQRDSRFPRKRGRRQGSLHAVRAFIEAIRLFFRFSASTNRQRPQTFNLANSSLANSEPSCPRMLNVGEYENRMASKVLCVSKAQFIEFDAENILITGILVSGNNFLGEFSVFPSRLPLGASDSRNLTPQLFEGPRERPLSRTSCLCAGSLMRR